MLNEYQQKIINSIKKGNLEEIRKLVIGKIDIDRPLLPYLEITLENSSNKNPFNKIQGPTPLILSILYEYYDIVKYLLNKDAKLDISVNSFYPIHFAILINNLDIIQLILSFNKLEVNRLTKDNYYPLHIAINNNFLESVLILLKFDSKINLDKDLPQTGNSFLHLAAKIGNPIIFEALISKGSNINCLNSDEELPIDIAQKNNNLKILDLFNNLNNCRKFDFLYDKYILNINSNSIETLSQAIEVINELKDRIEKLELELH